MPDLKRVLRIAENLQAFKGHARAIATELYPPLLLFLHGNLGAGKTTFVAEVLRAWGVEGANSPTFNLRNDYACARARVVHLDFYRLKPTDSALDLLPSDEDYSDAIVFVEWGEKASATLFAPFARAARLSIEAMADDSRRLLFEPL